MGRSAAPALGRRAMGPAFRLGSNSPEKTSGPLRGRRHSASSLQPRWTHLIVGTLAAIIIVPVGYVAYCMATLPVGGGLVMEPTPSALVVEAADGQVFATRGVFKGDKLSPQDVPANISRAIIAIEDQHFYQH